jgi:hypothetical protein
MRSDAQYQREWARAILSEATKQLQKIQPAKMALSAAETYKKLQGNS